MEEKKYTYEEFLEIIKKLRGKDGCPWDREQTHMSLRPCMMEEAYEVLAAIRILDKTNNSENLKEELGDVLLQVAMHAQIAQEEGLFAMEDVVSGIAEKMVRRHPHVFGGGKAKDVKEVLENWEEIKKKEKEGKSYIESGLKEIPRELPALTRATKVLKKADKLYRPQADFSESVEALKKACERLEKCSPIDYHEEIAALSGDMLMALCRIAGICKLSPEQLLADRTDDLIEECESKTSANTEERAKIQ